MPTGAVDVCSWRKTGSEGGARFGRQTNQQGKKERSMLDWNARPVFFVSDVERAMGFYVGQLGFMETNRYAEEGKVLVGGVERDGCRLLLSCQEPQKNGHGRYWILLDVLIYERFRADLEARGVALKDDFWGFDTMVVEDPDGNELFSRFRSPRLN
jgi:catechol 2,3-dioxygenase-like lactoylglutathione lyase family enzyme